MTAYRVQVTATIGLLHERDDDQAVNAYGVISLLTCLEAILGVITACLPVLKPVFNKVRSSLKKLNGWENTSTSLKSDSIPISMRVSHMLECKTRKRSGKEEVDSMISMEDLRRSESRPRFTSKAEKVVGVKVLEIHVQSDVHVDNASTQV